MGHVLEFEADSEDFFDQALFQEEAPPVLARTQHRLGRSLADYHECDDWIRGKEYHSRQAHGQ